MDKHTVHLFMGKDMASVAGAISHHVSNHGNKDSESYVHILTFQKEGDVYTIKDVSVSNSKKELTDETIGKSYFAELFSNTIAIGKGIGTLSPELYLCIHFQLYNEEQLKDLTTLIKWIKSSGSHYVIDVYGISYDLADIFCVSEEEKRQLLYKTDKNKTNTKSAIDYIVENLHKNGFVNRVFLMQNVNFKGFGLKLDKNTFIRIIGEFAILTSEQYYDLFPVSAVEDYEINAFGISALWFNKFFYKDILLTRSLLTIFDREGLNKTTIDDPLIILKKVQDFTERNTSLLNDFYSRTIKSGINENTITDENKKDICNKFKEALNSFSEELQAIINDKSMSLEERRLLYALLLREDDELMNDDLIMEMYPSLDECFKETIDLYVDENNKIIDESRASILKGPMDGAHIYNPINRLSELKSSIHKSKCFIRKSEARLKEIKENKELDNDSRKVIVNGNYVFGDDTFKLLNNVVEEPLDETYVPQKTSVDSADLRAYFSPVRNQGSIDSCSAFASCSIFEYILNSHDNKPSHVLSPRFLYYNVCEKNSDGTPIDNGSNFYKIMLSLANQGICKESLCPYSEDFITPPSEDAQKDAANRMVTKAMNVNVSHKDIISALAEGYPVGIALKLFNSFKTDSNGFIFRPTEEEINGDEYGWHAMVVCGFSEKQKIYIVRNSWGKDFGDKGYCYIPFSYIEDPELCRQACIITGINCHEISVNEIVNDVEFDWDSKDVEYAALRILTEEEKIELSKLKKTYRNIQDLYIKLLTDLSHTGKRDLIRDHAIQNYKSKQVEESASKLNPSNDTTPHIPLFIFGVGVLTSVALYYNDTAARGFCIALGLASALAALLWYVLSKNKQADKTDGDITIDKRATCNPTDIELHFRTAGILLDYLKETKNKIEKEHRKLMSYLLNLRQWNKQYKGHNTSLSDDLKDPFISILNDSDYERIFNQFQTKYTCDINLWNRFSMYEVDKERVISFKENLTDEVTNRITESCRDFSMFEYITRPSYEPYSIDEKAKSEYLSRIELQSLPFAQLCAELPNNSLRRILFVSCKETKRF